MLTKRIFLSVALVLVVFGIILIFYRREIYVGKPMTKTHYQKPRLWTEAELKSHKWTDDELLNGFKQGNILIDGIVHSAPDTDEALAQEASELGPSWITTSRSFANWDAYIRWDWYRPSPAQTGARFAWKYRTDAVEKQLGEDDIGFESILSNLKTIPPGSRILAFPFYGGLPEGAFQGLAPKFLWEGESKKRFIQIIQERKLIFVFSEFDQNGKYINREEP